MPKTNTPFDTKKHHIYIPFSLVNPLGEQESLLGILDTGAPRTEFSDSFLVHMGFIKASNPNIGISPALQTQKYGKLSLPSIEICGRTIDDFEVLISRFDKSWGVAAIIGLDFFRRFRVTIDYQRGQIVTEGYPLITQSA